MPSFFDKMRELWGQLEAGQKIILLSLSGAMIVTLVVFFAWLGQEDFTLLYSNLSPEESSRVIESLQKRGVDYRVSSGGAGVMVPARQVSELKVFMAGEGIISNGPVGYEIFDNQGIGVSEFTQNLNYQRALEGELSRSIGGLRGVETARVHLVIPKPALFKEERKNPTASVVLELGRPGLFDRGQVDAVQRMVSSSVEGLEANQVVVLDNFGTLLSGESNDDVAGLSNTQLELKQKVESYLAGKAQSSLEEVMGYGRALVRVNADLDFEQVESTREIVDPEVSAVISEVRSAETDEATGGNIESSTVNYEFNRVVENIIGSVGTVDRLSVAVLLDGKYEEDEEGNAVYQPLEQATLDGYRKIVESIVGYDVDRGDKIEVLNMPFDNLPMVVTEKGIFGLPVPRNVSNIVNRVLFFAGLGFLLLLFRKMGIRMAESLGRMPVAAAAGVEEIKEVVAPKKEREHLENADWDDLMSDQAYKDLHMEEQAKNLAMDKPEEIAQLVRTWMYASK
jgi:flagellar M-ring protein FliF